MDDSCSLLHTRVELWMTYLSAQSRQNDDEAFQSLRTYLQSWAGSAKKSLHPSSMITSSCDHYGYLKPCIVFDQPGDAWLLSQQPVCLLAALVRYLEQLTEKLAYKELAALLQSKPLSLLEDAEVVTMVLARVGGNRLNYCQVKMIGDVLTGSLFKLLCVLLALLEKSPMLDNVMATISSLSYGMAFFHAIVDPCRAWQKTFMNVHGVAPGFSLDQMIPTTTFIPDLFVAVFNHPWSAKVREEGEEAWLDLQLEVLHMIGAFFTNSTKYKFAVSEEVCLKLCGMLDPRERCSSMQVLTSKVVISLIRALHNSLADKLMNVDSAMMLVTYINLLSPRGCKGRRITPCIRMVSTLLDTVPALFETESCEGPTTTLELKKLIVELGFYEKVCEVLRLVKHEAIEKPEEAEQLVCSMFRSFSSITRNCPATRESFEHRVDCCALLVLITNLITPTESMLQESLNMLVEGEYRFKGQLHTLYNTPVVKMLFDWLDLLPVHLQFWLAERLHDLCSYGAHNKQRCCMASVFKSVLQLLVRSQDMGHTLPATVEALMVDIIEVLGAHSIQTGELKQLIGSLCPLEDGKLPTYYYRLLKSLNVIADSGSAGTAPLYYFDLRTEGTYISIPELKYFPASSSFSFHTWVWLDSILPGNKPGSNAELFEEDSCKQRRVLYSFFTNGGTGFEVFFTNNKPSNKTCTLVVATITKKEFITLALNEFPLDTQRWYSISVVYNVPKRLWGGKSEVQIYMNGKVKKIAVMKMPNFSDVFSSSLVGFAPTCCNSLHKDTCSTYYVRSASDSARLVIEGQDMCTGSLSTPIGKVHQRWGRVTNLVGLLSSFCIFTDAITRSQFLTLHQQGPNDLSLFQYKNTMTYDLCSKLFLYYNAKSVNEVCINLAPSQVNSAVKLSGQFTGHYYITWNVQDVLGSLGGVQLLFPILEQACLPVTQRTVDIEGRTCALSSSSSLPSVMPSWFGEKEGVFVFLKLLLAMLSNNINNQNSLFHSEGLATIAALLMKTSPTLITVSVFQTIQELVELFNHDEHTCAEVYKHLIFDFRVWSRPAYSVRIGHIQYISNVVRHVEEWRQTYGVLYLLDVIRLFYSDVDSDGSCDDAIQLDSEEKQSIREALLMIVKYYLLDNASMEEVDGLLGFVMACTDSSLQEKLLAMLKNLLTNSDGQRELGRKLWEKGTFLLSLMRASNMPVRLITIKIVSHLMSHYVEVESVLSTSLKNGSVSAAISHMTEPDMSSAIVLALTDLCVTKNKSNYTDFISNMDVFMAMLHLLREAPFNVRSTLCQLFNSIFHHTPEDVLRISLIPSWEVMFFYLLSPSQSDEIQTRQHRKTTSESPCSSFVDSTNVVQRADHSASPTSSCGSIPPPHIPTDSEITPSNSIHEKPTATDHTLSPSSTHHSNCTILDHALIDHTSSSSHALPVLRVSETDSLQLSTASSEKQFRPRSHVHVERVEEMESTIMPDKEQAAKKLRRVSLTVSTPWMETVDDYLNEEVARTVDIVTEILKHILWYSSLDQPPWKVWGKFFCLLDQFEGFIVPASSVKKKVFMLLINKITSELKEGVDVVGTEEKMLVISQALESFVISTYPPSTAMEDEEVQLLKLAHNFFPEINTKHYSLGLQEEYLRMLTAAGIFNKELSFTLQEKLVSQSATRILLGCLASGNKEYYVIASLRLEHLLTCQHISTKDIFFIFSNLARITKTAVLAEDWDWLQYVASILRSLFSFNYSRLQLEKELPHLPDHRMPNFGQEFAFYCSCKEWKDYVEGPLKMAEMQYSEVLMRWLLEKTGRTKECSKEAASDNKKRRSMVVSNEISYQKLQVAMEGLLADEVRRQESADSKLHNELSMTLQHWRNTKRFFTEERGAWSSRRPEHYLWKLDRTETFSRMRMRLARNYNYNTHEDASKLRDTGQSGSSQDNLKPDAELMAKVSKRTTHSTSVEDDDVLLEQLWSDANSPAVFEEVLAGVALKEKKLLSGVECHVIMLMERIPGKLEITNKHLYFLSSPTEKNISQTWYNTDFKIPLKKLREIHSRRFNMSRTALEIFLVDQTNYFINFPEKELVNTVYSTILSLHPPNLNRVGIRKPAKLLRESGLTSKWVKREISNFDYLMQLNTISGRTYNDLNQYPVFPWVLSDYTSPELNLEDGKVFRDFSKPVGVQKPTVEERVRDRYDEFEDPTMGRFHFGSHYSNAAVVMHFLIRLEPFTSLHVELQSGRFDFADRQFFSIPSTWKNIYHSGTDLKELIPEFFYQPEFLKNINRLDLGKLQTGTVLDDVILPAWACSAEDFIIKHREALESEYVSFHLHEWIDLIFGYKQTGPEAAKACNVFNFYTYEENVNLDSIKDLKERVQIESIINNFGQTPTQLFVDPHPCRMPLDAARKTQARGFTATFTGRRMVVNMFDHLKSLKAHCVDCKDPVVFVGTPSIQTKALLVSGNPEQLVTVNTHGLLNTHGWLPFANSKQRPFTFQFDPNAHFDRSRWQYVGGPFAQDIDITCKLFVLSPNSKHLVSGGHWDNSFRVHFVEKGKLSSRIVHHNDVVMCMALDKAGLGDHLITGSRDTSCAIWKFGANGIQKQPLQSLYGHSSEVLCVDINTELDLAISGAKDGTCLLHTVRQGHYIHTLMPRQGFKCEILQVAISGAGRLVVYSEDTKHRQRLQASIRPCLHLYTINGLLLLEKELIECINALVVVDKYLITGNTMGFLTFRNLFSFQQLHSLNLLQSINCISVVLDHHTKLCSHLLVGLASGKLIIFSIKDIPTEARP